jgi:L-fuculose-phosphate aldolase
MAKVKHRKLRQEIIDACLRMTELGINQGTAGNISARIEEGIIITPTGMPYETLTPSDLPVVFWDGTYEGDRMPSSEWRFHWDIQRTRQDIDVVVHNHAMHCVALACMHAYIPAFHYMVTIAGGHDIRCAKYARYGTQELSDNAIEALKDRYACLLANHGMIAIGGTVKKTLNLAYEVEVLAGQYWRVLAAGEPKLLSPEQMDEVLVRIKNYGKQPEEILDGTPPAMEPPPRRK